MRYIVFAFVILIILCCPFPLKISFIFKESKFKFHIYSFNVHKNNNKKNNCYNEDEKNRLIGFVNSINKNTFVIKYIANSYFKKGKTSLKKSKKPFKCTITFNIKYGFDNPCYTALLYPGIIAILNELQIYSFRYLKYKKINYDICPDFNNKILNLAFSGIFYVPLGKIIHISFLRLKALKIYKSRGEVNVPSN